MGLTDFQADLDRDKQITHKESVQFAQQWLDKHFNGLRPDRGQQQHPGLETDDPTEVWFSSKK